MSKRIIVGKILKAQGIKGEVKIKPIIDDENKLEHFVSFFVGPTEKEMKVVSCAVRFGFAYVLFEGIKTRNDAETLRNFEIKIDRDNYEVDENSYVIDEIIGSEIIDENGEFVGQLVNVEQYGAADVFIVLKNKRTYSVPFVADVFLSVDAKTRTIVVSKKAFEEIKL